MKALFYKGEDIILTFSSTNDLSTYTSKVVKFFTPFSAVKTATITSVNATTFTATLSKTDTADLKAGRLNIVLEFATSGGSKVISKTIECRLADPYVDGDERPDNSGSTEIVFLQNSQISVHFTGSDFAIDASQAAADALAYKTAAETAKTDALAAQTAAETAKTGAETAQTGAQTALTGAQTAQTAAETARDQAVAATADKLDKDIFLNAENLTVYEHPRGEAEFVGDYDIPRHSLGFYHGTSHDIIFNKILFQIKNPYEVHVNIYKSTGLLWSFVPDVNLTFIESFVIPIDNNIDLKSVLLSNPLSLLQGEYIYILISTKIASTTIARMWNTNQYEDRNGIIISTSTDYTNIFNQSWTVASPSGYPTTPIILQFDIPYLTKYDKIPSTSLTGFDSEVLESPSFKEVQTNIYNLSKEGVRNPQTWPENNYNFTHSTSTFSGWGAKVGYQTNFNSVQLRIVNRDISAVTLVRAVVRKNNKDGEILLDSTKSVNVLPGEDRTITIKFQDDLFQNSANDLLFLQYFCNKLITRVGYLGSGTITDLNNSDAYATNGSLTTMTNVVGGNHAYWFKFGEYSHVLNDDQIIDISERLTLPTPESESVDISLPDKLYAIVGDTLQLFYRGMIKHPYPYIYDILVSCSKGKQYPRYFEYLPTSADIGSTSFKIEVKTKDGNIVGTKTCTLITKAAVQSPTSLKKVLCVGDSLTSAGYWCMEASRRLTASDGTPAGIGLSNISFLGRKTGDGIGWEGTGGWTWESYISTGPAAYKFYVSGVVTAPSIGATYSNNGVTYTVSEINITSGTGYISALGSSSPSASGTLTKVSGTGDTTLSFSSFEADAGNPFWEADTNSLDFPQYVNTYMGGGCDVIYFLLSWNGQTPHRTDFSSVITSAKTLIDHIHTNYPNCAIKIMGIQVPSLNGGMGANYGATGASYADMYGMVVTALNMNKAYQDWCNETAYSGFMEFVNISAQFDSENNMPETVKSVNTRSTKTEYIGINGVHPDTEGYYQIGDAVFRNFVSNFCQ